MSGDFVEIVKCLQDGLASTDIAYKDACLEIILEHFHNLIEYLSTTPVPERELDFIRATRYFLILKELVKRYKEAL